jgi:ribosomal protein L7/L12
MDATRILLLEPQEAHLKIKVIKTVRNFLQDNGLELGLGETLDIVMKGGVVVLNDLDVEDLVASLDEMGASFRSTWIH